MTPSAPSTSKAAMSTATSAADTKPLTSKAPDGQSAQPRNTPSDAAHRQASPGVATGAPWTHPPNMQQFPPPSAPPSSLTRPSASGRSGSDSPAPTNGLHSSKNRSAKPPQTIADAVAASVGNKKERKRKVSRYTSPVTPHSVMLIPVLFSYPASAYPLLVCRVSQA